MTHQSDSPPPHSAPLPTGSPSGASGGRFGGGFHVNERRTSGQLAVDVALEIISQDMASGDGPISGDGQVQIREPLAPSFTGLGHVDPHLRVAVAVEDGLNPC